MEFHKPKKEDVIEQIEPIYPDTNLLDIINASCKKIASGNYEKRDVERLFELSKTDRYPSLFTELAESIGMMMVKVEAREFHLKQIIEELEKTKAS